MGATERQGAEHPLLTEPAAASRQRPSPNKIPHCSGVGGHRRPREIKKKKKKRRNRFPQTTDEQSGESDVAATD